MGMTDTAIQERNALAQLDEAMSCHQLFSDQNQAQWCTTFGSCFSELPRDQNRCCIVRGHTIIATADSWTELKEFMDKPQRY